MFPVLERPYSVMETADTTTLQLSLDCPESTRIFGLEIRLPLFLDVATKGTVRHNTGWNNCDDHDFQNRLALEKKEEYALALIMFAKVRATVTMGDTTVTTAESQVGNESNMADEREHARLELLLIYALLQSLDGAVDSQAKS
ncbi:hypothetical protein ETB97_004982 [Aspergillus alliaceus]|uniref:Uncharacterized protein n=1 Tax=Petromyces alliaceus TaxID=209559 RepID=A0A8H6A246_PETAA|nr:hypothetical protein ETB97_004982 [Aspergillus burnettii]